MDKDKKIAALEKELAEERAKMEVLRRHLVSCGVRYLYEEAMELYEQH